MKNLISFTILFFCSLMAFAQSDEYVNKVAYSANAALFYNNKIMVTNDNSNETIPFKISLERWSNVVDKPFEVKGVLVLQAGGNSTTISDTLHFTGADFTPAWSIVTQFKDLTATIPGSVYKQGTIHFRFAEKRVGIWSGFKTSTQSISTTFERPPLPSTITGPDHICDEGIYTITNPGTITLENAAGIATLTDLGNNQWQVERINNAVGTVVLKSLVGSNAYEKTIRIGTDTPISITGNSYSLDWSRSYTFTVNTEDANSILEIEKQGAPSVTFTRLDNNRFRLSTPPKPSSNAPITPIYVLNIRARVLDPECGNSEYIHQEIRVGTTVPFE